jgi:hypothetical protein
MQGGGEKDFKPKKKGSIFSFFKKSGRKRNPYGDDFIHVEPKQDGEQQSDSEQDERIPDLHGDQAGCNTNFFLEKFKKFTCQYVVDRISNMKKKLL